MNKYKTLAVNTVVFAIGSFGSKILSFLLTNLYTNYLNGPEGFNSKEILELAANMLIPLVSLSVAEAIIRFGLDKRYDTAAVFSNAVTALILGAGGLALLSPLLLLYSTIRPQVPLLVLFVLASCFRQVSAQFARARGMVKLFALDGIFCTLMFFIFNCIFIVGMKLDITGFMLSNILADTCSGIGVWLIAKHGRYFSLRKVDKSLLRSMLRFSIPLIPTAEMWLITGFSDRIFVEQMVSPGDAGVYGAATKIPNLLSMVSTIFYQAWNMSAIRENDSGGRREFYSQVFEAYQAVLALAAGGLIALDLPFTRMLIKNPLYDDAFLYTPVLVIAVMLMCVNQFLSSIYTVTKHTRNSFWTSLVAAVLNLILNYVLISRFAVYGAIAATFASYFVCCLIRMNDTRRYIKFDISFKRFFLNMILLFGMAFAVSHLEGARPAYEMTHGRIPLLLLLGLLLLFGINLKPLLRTVKKVLKRE